MKWKLLVKLETGFKYKQGLSRECCYFLYGDVGWGSRWLGLKKIQVKRLKLHTNIPEFD